jgi:hypothetical protein
VRVKSKPKLKKPVAKPRPRPKPSKKSQAPARRRPSQAVPRRPIQRPAPPVKAQRRIKPRARPVSKPAPIVKTPYPADWFLSDYTTGATRRSQLVYLRKTIAQLRVVYRGFDAKSGFDARYPQNWTARQHQEVQAYGVRLHSLMGTQHLIVRPRTKAEEKALRVHTQQKVARQKAFVIHTSKPLKAEVHFVTQPMRRMPFFAPPIGGGLRVEMVATYQGGELVLTDRDYLFEEMLGFQPIRWEDFITALRMLLPLLPDKTPTGKGALYTLLSREHGPISSPVLKEFLLEEMQRWAEAYSNDFAGTLIGVRYQGDRWTAAMSPQSEYNKRQERRTLYRKIREEDAREARKISKPVRRKN